MRLSRRTELLSLIGLWVGSLIALALVVSYAVLPNLPHDQRLNLSLHDGATIMSQSKPVNDTDGSGVRTHTRRHERDAIQSDCSVLARSDSPLLLCVCSALSR